VAGIFGEVADGRTARMVTVIGDAGVGKSRLVREVIERIAAGSRVLTGRCLPYGDGITFWPLLMMVREAAGIRDADSPEAARALLLEAVHDREVADRLASAAGGNPLYAEQMLSMLIDDGALRLEAGQWVRADLGSEIAVPPTIHALLEARLDKLARAERATVEPASVIGLEFPQPAVESLAP